MIIVLSAMEHVFCSIFECTQSSWTNVYKAGMSVHVFVFCCFFLKCLMLNPTPALKKIDTGDLRLESADVLHVSVLKRGVLVSD